MQSPLQLSMLSVALMGGTAGSPDFLFLWSH